MRGYYDYGLYDVDTYDEGSALTQTASNYKADMTRVLAELDSLIPAPTASPDFLIENLQSLIANGIVSQVTIQETDGDPTGWPYSPGRYMVMDVIHSATRLLADVRHTLATRQYRWSKVRRDIHPSWFSFYNDSHKN